jgi:IPT/TIG domain/Family of unknown function (DUF5719)/Fibronectin type III domain
MWDANTESDLAGYIVQYGTQSGSPSTSINVGNVTSRTITGLTAGTTYYFRVVAYNTSGQQSAPSPQVTYTVAGTTSGPTITSVSPTSGPTTGGTQITISGTNFATGATVRVGGTLATGITLVSSTQLRATTPPGSAGARDVQVTNSSGSSAIRVGAFTYTATSTTPTLTSVSPTSGPTTGGTTITLTGTNFVSGATVRVGGVAATNVVFSSATQVTARTPAGTAGARDVQITNPNGQSATRTGAFTYTTTTGALTATAVSPTSGPTSGGTVITVTGTNFVSGATIRIGGTPATGVTFVSSTQLRGTTPAKAAGGYTVQVVNPNGQSANTPSGFTYTATTGAPTVSAVSPASGPTSGGTVITVTGTSFVSGARVSIGTLTAGNVVFVSSTQLRATTPYSSTTGARDVRVTNPNGQYGIRPGGFTYGTSTTTSLTLTSVSPASGPTSGGTVITVTGTGFVSGARVSIGTLVAGSVAFVSSTQLRATTPAATAGARDVRVTNPNGSFVTRTGAFTYTAPTTGTPTVTSVSPSSGPTSGGTVITVTGTSFVSGARVFIGTLAATNVTFVSSTQLFALTAPAATAGTRDVRVTNPDGRYGIRAGGFTYKSSTTSATSTLTAAAPTTLYLAEGVQTEQMSTQLAIANAEPTDAQVNLTFMDTAGQTTEMAVDVPARSRQTVDLNTVPQLAGTSFSTRVDSSQPVAVDRLVTLDAEGQSASLETAVDQASASWYFAEGSTVDPMELFYLVQNPGTTPAEVQVRYLLPDGQAPVTRRHTVAPGSRATIWVDHEDPSIAASDVAAEITSVDGTPIVVERSLYLKEAGSAQPRGGDSSAGVTAPATSWFVEAATGSFATRLLLANPGTEAVRVRATYQPEDGHRVVRTYTVPAASRQTIDVAAQDASLAEAQLGITVEASAPIVVERTKSWGVNGTLDEVVSGAGTTEGGARWLLAEGEMGGAREAQTEVSIFNQGAATEVTVTLLFEDGPEAAVTFPIAAGARLLVPMADAFPSAAGRRFSVLVEGADPSASVIVDRAIFWQGAGGTRTAGADGAATRLR